MQSSTTQYDQTKAEMPARNLETLTDKLLDSSKVKFSDVEQPVITFNTDLQLATSIAGLAVINVSTLNMLEKCISKQALTEIINSYLTE